MKKKILSSAVCLLTAFTLGGLGGGLLTSCSDNYMEDLNTDET